VFPFFLQSVVLKIMAQQSVDKTLVSGMGGCASSASVEPRPIDIASSIVDMDIKSLKKVCSIVIDKIARKLEKKEQEEKDGEQDDKNGKRKRD